MFYRSLPQMLLVPGMGEDESTSHGAAPDGNSTARQAHNEKGSDPGIFQLAVQSEYKPKSKKETNNEHERSLPK